MLNVINLAITQLIDIRVVATLELLWTQTWGHSFFISFGACEWSESRKVVSNSLWPYGLYSPWNSPGQNTGVGSRSLLQEIFPTQGSNPGLSHCKRILYQLNHKGSPRILEWVAYPFSRGSSRPRNLTGVSCIAGGFFTDWAIREVPSLVYGKHLKQYLAFGKCFALDL